jgi:pyruvate dehydrogenase E2 component (dihydrolipoamide acetyltransferase)
VDSTFDEQNLKDTAQSIGEREKALADAAKDKLAKAKDKGKADKETLRRNAHNPVVVGNAVIFAAIGTGLGYGAYQRHLAGKLSWETVGLWSGAVGLFATVDYFVSKYVLSV